MDSKKSFRKGSLGALAIKPMDIRPTPKRQTEPVKSTSKPRVVIGRFTFIDEEEEDTSPKEREKYKGGSYVVHVGPRNGKYLLVKGEKVYLKK